MCTIDIGIGHDDDLIISQLCNIKVISVSFRKSAAKCIDHRLDLCIGKHLINTCFFDIQNLTANRQDRLEITVSCRFCRSPRRISLHDKNFAF